MIFFKKHKHKLKRWIRGIYCLFHKHKYIKKYKIQLDDSLYEMWLEECICCGVRQYTTVGTFFPNLFGICHTTYKPIKEGINKWLQYKINKIPNMSIAKISLYKYPNLLPTKSDKNI